MNENEKKKIVPFPNLKKRLLEKAMEHMKEKKFHEALSLFDQARENDYSTPEVELGSVVCLMEIGRLVEAKNRCKKMLHEDVGDYFHVLQIYITILIQLKEYEEVKVTIEAILQEDKVPAEQAQTFYQLLEFARKMLPENSSHLEDEPITYHLSEEKLLSGSLQDQYSFIQELKLLNIKPYKKAIQTYLLDKEKHPILKTILLQVLHEQEWKEEVEVQKLDKKIRFRPIEKTLENLEPFFAKIESLLEKNISSENPTLYESLKGMVVRINLVMYPIPLEEEDYKVWAASIHYVGQQLFGLVESIEVLAQLYEVTEEAIRHIVREIEKLEEISYLQL